MRILVVGSGGREHALCWAIAASPLCDALFCAPGNAGVAQDAECVPVEAGDIEGLLDFARREGIDFVVVGPEGPLAAGLADRLAEAGIKCFGPTRAAARLESSKSFAKAFCERHGIPTAAHRTFEEAGPALEYVRARGAPIVVKADGLAAGKGVTVAATVAEAEAAILAALRDGAFGAAGAKVVVEEFMEGEEASFLALCDGTRALPLAAARDHKRAGDGDSGPNTGGMGACSPAAIVDEAMAARIVAGIVEPAVAGMAAEGTPFQGVLYAGLMIGPEGPRVVEFNARFGDPECQVLVARLRSDILPALVACADGQLAHFDLRWRDEAAVCVVMAARGYPGAHGTGSRIEGIERAEEDPEVAVFHAGTARDDSGALVARGGRVLGVTATGADLAAARAAAYAAVGRIDWPEGFCRSDIAGTGA